MRSPRLLCSGLLLATGLTASPAFAQQGNAEYPAACEESKVGHGDRERAHAVYSSGKQYLDESNYEKAISYFKDAYTIDCSVHGILIAIATAYERKGDKPEAIRALGEYLKRAPTASDRDTIEHRIRNLRDQVSRETAPAAPSPAATPAVAPATAPAPAPSPPAVSSPPPPPPAAASNPTTLAPPPSGTTNDQAPEQESSGPGAAPWILVGVGGAALIAGVVVFAKGAGDISTAKGQCNLPGGKCPSDAVRASAQATMDNGYKLENAGGAVAGVGLAALVGGFIWWRVAQPKKSGPPTALVPYVSPTGAGLSFSGHF